MPSCAGADDARGFYRSINQQVWVCRTVKRPGGLRVRWRL